MSDMELSVAGEDGDVGDDEYDEGEDRHSITIQTSNYHNQGDNHGGTLSSGDKTNNSNNNNNNNNNHNGNNNNVDNSRVGRREPEHRRMVDITRDKPVKVTVRVVVPVRDHPKFNFVGKLLGPKGNSLKRLQEDTMTKMAILGRGSMRDKHKEEELRLSGDPKFSHLHEDLHVEITAFAPPAEAHARIAYALADVRRFLVPDYNDDIRQEQMWEMQILKERPENSGPISEGLGIHVFPAAVVSATSTGTPSPTNSNGSRSPQSPPSGILDAVGPQIVLPAQHPALRGIAAVRGVKSPIPVPAVPNLGVVTGRKRPLIPGSTRHVLSPTKRTVMSILARARAAQAKDIPGYRIEGAGPNLVGIGPDLA